MNIVAEKKTVIEKFSDVRDESVIRMIKDILDHSFPILPNDPMHALSYAPEKIEVNNRLYLLNYPIRCLFEKQGDHFLIKNELLDIYAVGSSESEAESDFSEEFDYLYQRLTSTADVALSDQFVTIKQLLGYFVKEVKHAA